MIMKVHNMLKTLVRIVIVPFLFTASLAFSATDTEQAFIFKAERGSAYDKMRLGLRYAMGDGVKADDNAAQEWFLKAAEENYAPAQVGLASMKSFDSDVQDISGAVNWLRKAAQQHNIQAQSELSRLLLSGMGIPRDPKEGEKWQKNAEQLTLQQQLEWAWKIAATHAERWKVIKGDSARRLARNISTFQETGITLNVMAIGHAIESGDNAAKTIGAMLLATGNGVKADEKLAGDWFLEAAESGYAPAQAALGQLYRIGWGTFKKNDHIAAKWMKKAADQKLLEAQIQYAKMLASGIGVSIDKATAILLLEEASKTGHAEALMILGLEKLSQGDRAEAAKLLSLAANSDNENVLSVLAVLYGWGNAPVINESEKMTEVRRYAQRKDRDAQLLLGLFFAEGWGTPIDYEEAAFWYKTAISYGNQDAMIPWMLLNVSFEHYKEAEHQLKESEKNHTFGFLHEKDLLRQMFEEIEESDDVLESEEKRMVYKNWRQRKITRQMHFLKQQAEKGSPVAGYLYGMLTTQKWNNVDDDSSLENSLLMQQSLTKLCMLSRKSLEKECQMIQSKQ